MLDPNRNRNQTGRSPNQLPPPVTTGRGAYTPGTPIAPRTGPRVPVAQRVDFSSTPALQRLFQPAPASKGYTQSNVNAGRNRNVNASAGLVAPPIGPPPNPPPQSRGGQEGGRPGTGLVRAAQAQTPPSRTAPPLAQPARFTDPVGRVRQFADQGSANAAAAKLQSPAGVAGLRNEALQRGFDLTSTGQIPEGTFTPEEQALVAPELRAAALDGSRAQPVDIAPAAVVGGPADGVDVIRGTSVQRTGADGGTGGGGGSPTEIYRDALAANLQAGLEHGADIRQYAPEIKFLSEAEENSAATVRASQGRLPTLSQFQAQRAQELTQNPEGINPADQLVFGKGGSSAVPKVYTRKLYEDPSSPGFQTGELPYTLDSEGNPRPLNFAAPAAAGAPEGSAGQAPAGAVEKLRKNPKLAPAFKAKYGYLPEGL